LLFLHGWPEFWAVWARALDRLAGSFDVIAPDLRGFGATDKPELPAEQGYRVEDHVDDLRSLAEVLGLGRFGLVSHDVGAYVAQSFARAHPDRLVGLFFFDCPYPGIGRRWAEADHLKEIWYQSFHQQGWAAELIGSSRRACEIYLRHFLSHWAHRRDAFDDREVQAWVDNFMAPGNLQGGFNWYIAANRARVEMIKHGPPKLPRIEARTCVRWGASDEVLKVEWADRLGDYFSDYDFAPVEEAGHFVPHERPDYAAQQIADFYAGLGP
jgi:pimeloyl-ACP methyl ester carboxylesterase